MKNYFYSYRIIYPNPVSVSHFLYLDRLNFEIFLAHYQKELTVERNNLPDGQYETIFRYNGKLVAIEDCYLPDDESEDLGRMEE